MDPSSTNVKIFRGYNSTKRAYKTHASEILLSVMKEVNLNQRLQNELLQCVSSGKSIPFVPKSLIKPKSVVRIEVNDKPLKLPPKPIQRSKTQIEQSGIYEIEKYRPDPSKTRPFQEKERFQDIMAFGKDIDKERQALPKEKIKGYEESFDMFDEILLEIEERKEFIEDMRKLGMAKKYLPEIQCQIAVRLKELEKLDQLRALKIASES